MSDVVVPAESAPVPGSAPGCGDLDEQLEQYRRELTAHCSRILGCWFEAEDAVQETFVRAWRAFDGFEGRASLRSWLYRIATNVCLDMRGAVQRRARPIDVASWRAAGRATQPDAMGLEPIVGCYSPPADDQRPLLQCYVDSFERCDLDFLGSLLC